MVQIMLKPLQILEPLPSEIVISYIYDLPQGLK